MKRGLKITIILLMMIMSLGQTNYIYARDTTLTQQTDTGGSYQQAQTQTTNARSEWDNWSPLLPDENIENELSKRAGIILGVIRALGMVVSVIILMILGIKQMTASVEEKSIIKQAMPGYILGAIMVFAITWLPSLIYNLVNGK